MRATYGDRPCCNTFSNTFSPLPLIRLDDRQTIRPAVSKRDQAQRVPGDKDQLVFDRENQSKLLLGAKLLSGHSRGRPRQRGNGG